MILEATHHTGPQFSAAQSIQTNKSSHKSWCRVAASPHIATSYYNTDGYFRSFLPLMCFSTSTVTPQTRPRIHDLMDSHQTALSCVHF